jgi:hypothetical protein
MKILIELNGLMCSNKMDFFKIMNDLLSFPKYFSYNWDSFEECIYVVAEGLNENIAIYINEYEVFLSEDRQDKKIFKSIARAMCANKTIIFYKSKVL